MASKKDFLDFSLKFLDGSGLGPFSRKYKKIISLGLLLPLTIIVEIFVVYGFFHVKNDILKTAELMESFSSFGQLFVRKFVLFTNKNLISDILQKRKNLWTYDTFGKSFGNRLRLQIDFATNVVKGMWTISTILASLICFSAIFDNDKKVPLECWTPDDQFLVFGLFIFQTFAIIEIIYLVGAVDAFFVLVCVDLKIQFELLSQKFRLIRLGLRSEKQGLNDLFLCAKHHNLLLELHQKLNTIFSKYFIVQYILTVLAASVQLYILLYISVTLQEMLKCVFYLLELFFQVAMFFMPASKIEEEADKLAVEIYNVNWEVCGGKIRSHLMFMLMKAQKPLCMMGEGMVYITRSEYVVLFRLAFSISTLMGGINGSGKMDTDECIVGCRG